MPAPFPHEARRGSTYNQAESEAMNLYKQYGWLARWVDEMIEDSVITHKRAAQFFLQCYQYRRWYDELMKRGEQVVATTMEGTFRTKKVVWRNRATMFADLKEIYEKSKVATDWFEANGEFLKHDWDHVWNTDDPMEWKHVEVLRESPKTESFSAMLADFRAAFE